MKRLLSHCGKGVRASVWMAALAACSVTMTSWAERPPEREPLPPLDVRTPAPPDAGFLAARNDAFTSLKQRLPDAEISFSPITGSPRFVRARDGFLTGAGGVGRSVPAGMVVGADAYAPVRSFIDAHSGLFGHGSELLDAARINRDHVSPASGLRTVVWQQQLGGVPVFEALLLGNLTARGELVTLASELIPDVAAAADLGTPGWQAALAAPPVTAESALAAAYNSIGVTLQTPEVSPAGPSVADGDFEQYQVQGVDAYAGKTWLPMSRDELRLCWQVIATSLARGEMFQVLVDAETGGVLMRRCLTEYISDATYNVYTSDSPSPFSPGHDTPSAVQPPVVPRELVTIDALSVEASPNGWINDGDNETLGNNVQAHTDTDADNQPDLPRPQGNPTRVFDFPLDLAMEPATYTNASVVQLFYVNNVVHDRLYDLGFTEAAGNFQTDNFGRGGLGNDAVRADAQDGSGFNNANFSTPPDGIPGRMQMYIFNFPTPTRDGDLDSEVVIHEYVHGLSNRRVGGGSLISALATRGMGEGWSDFYALMLLSQPGDDVNAVYASGGYVTYQFAGLTQNYYFGIRRYPYCTDLSKNPLTFKDIDPTQASGHAGIPRNPIFGPFDPAESPEVHNQGEVWCATLWEVHANLVAKHGYEVGHQLTLQLVTDALALSPANPNFLEARDAVVLADEVLTGGANALQIWQGFAKRGMGFSAEAPPSTTTTGVVEAYDIPGLRVVEIVLVDGNGNLSVDPNECSQLFITLEIPGAEGLTNIQATLFTETPDIIVTRSQSTYPNIPPGGFATNTMPFEFSTSPVFVCGRPVEFSLLIKSDQVTVSNRFSVASGQPGVVVRFDNNTPVPIPDASRLGAVSPITVAGFTGAVQNVRVALHVTHTWTADLLLQLISPQGVTNTLSANNGGSGNNYGSSCLDGQRTLFDDAAAVPISAGSAPFVGSFRPQGALAVFNGSVGGQVNGTWTLRVEDQVGLDIGTIQCWSLLLTPATCLDGGGGCPGSDVAVGIRDLPDPVTQGSNLTYTITVTNFGPQQAKGVVMSQQLPPTALFVSATTSQGSVSHGGGIVTASIGDLAVGAVATVTVRVTPTQVGQISTLATVSAVSDIDFNPANNAATATTRVDPPLAELAVSFFDTPDPVLQGGVLTYTTYVTNNGPSIATGVTLTNLLPISAPILNAVPSQGSVVVLSNFVLATLGPLPNGATASLTVSVRPLLEGSLQAFAGVTALQPDPVPFNNSGTAQTVVGPATDLALGMTVDPASAVVGSNFTAFISVTNLGPSTASGVVVNHLVPSGAQVVSSTTSQGSSGVSNGIVVASLGILSNAASATVTVVMRSTNLGQFLTTATVSGPQADPVQVNNTASRTVTIAQPFVLIETAGATLISESFSPPNGAVDIGEIVTVELRLRNQGNIAALSTLGTLQSGNGVGSPSGAQSYGNLPPGGLAVGRSFTFTAQGSPGGTVEANLAVTTNGVAQSTIVYTFSLPQVWVFNQTNRISIPDSGVASNYPSTLTVNGVTGTVGRVVAVLSNLTHTFPQDIDVLLKGPGNERSILMSDAGGTTPAHGVTLTFDDQAAALIAQSAQLVSGSFRPADYQPGDTFPLPAPAGPYVAAMAQFNGMNPNGPWSLFVNDDTPGDQGQVTNGWSLRIHTVTPVNKVTDLQLLGGTAPLDLEAGNTVTMTFSVTNAGPDDATSVTFTNLLPSEFNFASATSSQGSVVRVGSVVSGVLGDIPMGAVASVTIMGVPQVSGTQTNLASVGSSEIDVNPVNNLLALPVNAGQPVADGSLTGSAAPEPVVTGGQVTYELVVTNRGPGPLLNVRLTNSLPVGVSFVSGSASAGTVTNNGGVVVATLGSLASNATAHVSIVAQANTPGQITNAAILSTSSSDPDGTNNVLSMVSTVANPAPKLVAAGALIQSENLLPNGTVDPGETVTMQLTLANLGQLNTTNLLASLAPGGGVNSPSAAQNYGAVLAGGPSVSRTFTFTAGPAPGPVTATLQLTDGAAGLGEVHYVFALPAGLNAANTTLVSIPELGAASVYPSVIQVTGVTGLVSGVQATLSNLNHQFPDDLDILLVSPTGARVLLMSDCGGGNAISNRVLTFRDNASGSLPNASTIVSGTYKPTDFESGDLLPPPALAGAPSPLMAVFNGADPNGSWSLYISDDSAGDAGLLSGGWSLSLTTVQPVNPAADLSVLGSVTPGSGTAGSPLVYTFHVLNSGPDTATGVMLTNTLPESFVFNSATTPQGAYTNQPGKVIFSLGDVAAGASLAVTVTATPPLPGGTVNEARVSSASTDLNPTDNLAMVMATITSAAPPTVTASFESGTDEFTVNVQGTPGQVYVVESTSDFLTWTGRLTNAVPESGVFKFVESPASARSAIYYRAYRAP